MLSLHWTSLPHLLFYPWKHLQLLHLSCGIPTSKHLRFWYLLLSHFRQRPIRSIPLSGIRYLRSHLQRSCYRCFYRCFRSVCRSFHRQLWWYRKVFFHVCSFWHSPQETKRYHTGIRNFHPPGSVPSVQSRSEAVHPESEGYSPWCSYSTILPKLYWFHLPIKIFRTFFSQFPSEFFLDGSRLLLLSSDNLSMLSLRGRRNLLYLVRS